jgi:predicted DNA repair protein MutK
MASSLLLLLDDIATVLDDVSILTKVAAKKTAGVLGDDLALNAQQVAGVKAERELPVVWAVCKGSFVNKAILVPAALLIGSWLPWLVTPLLMIGGAFLCFEGCEKLAHKFLHKEEHAADVSRHEHALADPAVDLVAVEKDKIKGAVRTDFILSAEIIAITLGTVQGQSFVTQLSVLVGIALIMTIGVYGLVAGIVKLDDAGLYLSRRESAGSQALGRAILAAAPWLMKALSIAGTAAMFLVGGGILVHGVPALGHAVEAWAANAGSLLGGLGSIGVNAGVGIVAGAIVLAAVELAKKALGRKAKSGIGIPKSALAQLRHPPRQRLDRGIGEIVDCHGLPFGPALEVVGLRALVGRVVVQRGQLGEQRLQLARGGPLLPAADHGLAMQFLQQPELA